MYDDIRGDLRLKPIVSWVLIATCILATNAVLFDSRFEQIFGVHDNHGVHFLTRATAPFIHGYSFTTAIFHLLSSLVLIYFLATFLEKIIGSLRFLLLTFLAIGIYVFMHRFLLMIGHGLTPVFFCYSGVLLIVQLEARFVKTNTVFDDYYRLMWTVLLLTWIITPVLFSIAPIYFDSKAKLFQKLFYGNVLHVVCFIFGIIIALIFRQFIRNRLVHYTRKKYLPVTQFDKWAWIGSLVFVVFLTLIFVLRP